MQKRPVVKREQKRVLVLGPGTTGRTTRHPTLATLRREKVTVKKLEENFNVFQRGSQQARTGLQVKGSAARTVTWGSFSG
ncbi:hypothetical protein DPEC_G00298250 [Dallia pectoralis]|uniref:Uncharacterized protein n=1 Tax=Dallia pectoralis TaxID=75939 RepID=A0ACC2FFW5_DALPE|nr:hypothetical protein DPEC_G00298250 [Dallia pectoralis]